MKTKLLITIILMAIFGFSTIATAEVLPLEPGETVLLLDTTVINGLDSLEAQVIRELGYTPQIASEEEWRNMTTE